METDKFIACRHYLGMSQSQFADFLSISAGAVGRIESGDLRVSNRIRGKLASKFDFDDSFAAYYRNFIRSAQ
ncbi:helix-turn-helix domain-containing protein [Planococcus beigongshangi]|uniref:helix-turn-helix domain-containing protein n=1 Tax=Planococcus beigongshangi TaxID=2782536 RepID=UPI00193B77D8|nr:helix-turn-helix transcriptional regulator [Planococcus beigongshangi]